jgi:hypothetical protein
MDICPPLVNSLKKREVEEMKNDLKTDTPKQFNHQWNINTYNQNSNNSAIGRIFDVIISSSFCLLTVLIVGGLPNPCNIRKLRVNIGPKSQIKQFIDENEGQPNPSDRPKTTFSLYIFTIINWFKIPMIRTTELPLIFPTHRLHWCSVPPERDR